MKINGCNVAWVFRATTATFRGDWVVLLMQDVLYNHDKSRHRTCVEH